MARILIADDENSIRKAVARYLSAKEHVIFEASDGEEAVKISEKEFFDVAIVDLVMPKINGIELIQKLRRKDPNIAVIVITAHGSISSAIQAIKSGAYHYLTKPFDLEDLSAIVDSALEFHQLKQENVILKSQLKDKYKFESMVGKSEEIVSVFKLVQKVAPTDSTILILGESGTGKELIAKAVHFNSERKDRNLVTVNCAAIPEQLLESELFGHVKGSFTGAIATRPGRFDSAHEGTIFLDEIGDMSPKLQVKLLRVLQEQTFEPVGSNMTHKVDVRVIAATNQDLEKAVKERRFREDLYYRLNVIPIHIPPLRSRKSDIPLLVQYFIEKFNQQSGHLIEGVDSSAMKILMRYEWPGNIRELENVVERSVVLKARGVVTAEDLPEPLRNSVNDSTQRFELESDVFQGVNSLKDAVAEYERQIIKRALKECNNNKNKASAMLGINRTTLVEKVKKLKISD